MMKKAGPVFLILVLSLSLPFESYAQQRAGLNTKSSLGPGNLYNPSTVERIKGEVLSVDEFTLAPGMPPGVELLLKTDGQEVIHIYLGPQWYLENADFEIEARDRIEVKGSKINYEGKPALVAAVVFRGEEVLKLRDENGVPVWSAWAPRR